jgi:sugar phosphate permease
VQLEFARNLKRRRSLVFYGWWIVIAGFVNQAVAAALIQRSYGAYVVLLREEFGWSKAALSGAFSLQQIENGLLGPVQGWLIDRFGPRSSMRAGVVIFGAGFILFSQTHSLTAFYVSYLLIALGSSLGGYFPFTVVIVNWFDQHRARALSLMQTGGAVGGLLVVAVAFSLETFGWRTTAFVSGLVIIVAGLPLVQVARKQPEDMGLRVDGRLVEELGDADDAMAPVLSASPDFSLREAMRTPAFWLIGLGHGSALLVVSAVNVHLILHLTTGLDYSLAVASLVVTVITAAQVGGTVLGGVIGDRFDKRLISMACMAGHAIGLLLVALVPTPVMVFTFAVLHGAAWGLRGPMMGAIRADYFGRSSYGAILGVSSLITMFGSIIGPLVAGVLADRTGSYDLGFTILALLSGLGSVFFLMAKRPLPPPSGARA